MGGMYDVAVTVVQQHAAAEHQQHTSATTARQELVRFEVCDAHAHVCVCAQHVWLRTYVLFVDVVDLQDSEVVVLVDVLEVKVVDAMTVWHVERWSRQSTLVTSCSSWKSELVTGNETC